MIKPKKDRNLTQLDGKWYVDFTFNKKRTRRFGGYTKEQARNTLAKMRIDGLDERLGHKRPVAEDVAFERFAEDFIANYARVNKRSWRRDVEALKRLKPFFRGKMLRDIGPELAERYKAKRRAEVAPATVNRELTLLKTIFNKAVEWGRLEASQLNKVKRLKEPVFKEHILTPDEQRALLEAARGRLGPILTIALNTGMRRGEILALRWEHVDLARRHIHVADSKSGRSRDIPMNAPVVEALATLPQHSPHVFVNAQTGEPIKAAREIFKAACKRAGIKALRFHDLRHTAATRMVAAGVDLVTVKELLGHSSIEMTMRYAHPTPENKRRAVEKLAAFHAQTRQKVAKVKSSQPVIPLVSGH